MSSVRAVADCGVERASLQQVSLPIDSLTTGCRMIPRTARVWVTGHLGLVGSAVVRRLRLAGIQNLLIATRDQLDLREQRAVSDWVREQRPEFVIHVAGKVGAFLRTRNTPPISSMTIC